MASSLSSTSPPNSKSHPTSDASSGVYPTRIYKIVTHQVWADAVRSGIYHGAPVDLADGFIHFSSPHQVAQTAAKHFHGQTNLIVVAFAVDSFAEHLKWEPSRGGDLFPHLYASLDPSQALWTEPMPLNKDGLPIPPKRIATC